VLLWIAIILAVLWLLGLIGNIGGGLIHLLLVIAVVVLIFHFIRAGRALKSETPRRSGFHPGI
jgi:hypothetical protein